MMERRESMEHKHKALSGSPRLRWARAAIGAIISTVLSLSRGVRHEASDTDPTLRKKKIFYGRVTDRDAERLEVLML